MNATIEQPETGDKEQKLAGAPWENLELEFLWRDCSRSGAAYDLYLGRISRNPVVRSHATGEHFMLPWARIIQLAVEKGIDKK